MIYELTKENFAEVSVKICKAFAEGKNVQKTNQEADFKFNYNIKGDDFIALELGFNYCTHIVDKIRCKACLKSEVEDD